MIESYGFTNHLKLPHYVTFQAGLESSRRIDRMNDREGKEVAVTRGRGRGARMIEELKFQKSFNYAFIDEFTKKEIRRKTLKAVCIPGYQVPYSSPEMPISRGWGTGGLHLIPRAHRTRRCLQGHRSGQRCQRECLQPASVRQIDDQLRTHFRYGGRDADSVAPPCSRGDPDREADSRAAGAAAGASARRGALRGEDSQMHAEADYAKIWVTLYESYVRSGSLMQRRRPSHHGERPLRRDAVAHPELGCAELNMARCLYLFGAGREKRIHCIPPFTRVEPLEFEDIRFKVEEFVGIQCSATKQDKAFMDQIYADDFSSSYVVNDSNFLDKLRQGPRPPQRLFTNPE